jgi:putative ABC transport system permease protein
MTPTLARFGLRYSLRHPWQFGLAVLGIALGVAVVVSIDLSNASARRAFELSSQAVVGATTHQVEGGPTGLADETYRRLRVEGRIRPSAPVVEGYVGVAGRPGHTLHLLGVDPFAEQGFREFSRGLSGAGSGVITPLLSRPGTVVLSTQTARQLGIEAGDELTLTVNGRERPVEVIALLDPVEEIARQGMDHVVLADISTAQELLDMAGRLSRIDLIVPDGPEGVALLQRIKGLLPAGATLVDAAARSSAMLQMTHAFRLNLTMLSLLAVVVGMFLIYNTMTFSVVQRRALLGTLRAVGVTRAEVFRLVLAEAAVLGVVGSLVGLALGVVLAQSFLGLITRTINDLYYVLSVREVTLSPWTLAKGLVMGVGASLFAATLPALEAMRVPPRVALSRSAIEGRVRRLVQPAAIGGGGLLLLSAALLLLPSRSLVIGFVALLGVIVGFTLIAPGATLALTRLSHRPVAKLGGVLGPMAARGVAATLSRTAVAVAALMVAISATVGVGIMVDSFRQSVAHWLASTLRADIYVSPPGPVSTRSLVVLDGDLVARLADTPGVAHVSTGRQLDIVSERGPSRLNVFQMAPESYARFRFLEGDPATVWPAFEQGEAVIVSEPYAYRHRLRVGSRLRLRTDRGEHRFPVAGVYADYGSDQGVVSMSRRTYQRYWDDQAISALGIYATPGTDLEALIQDLRARAGTRQSVLIQSNRSLREISLEVFDRTFTITIVLRLLATLVAFVGVLSALMALQLERAREVAVLRASGLTGGQVWALVSSQTGVMGLIAGLLAIPLGIVLALVLILVINRRSFGWTLQVHLDPMILAHAVLLAVGAALLAGLYPAWRMARTPPALALRED